MIHKPVMQTNRTRPDYMEATNRCTCGDYWPCPLAYSDAVGPPNGCKSPYCEPPWCESCLRRAAAPREMVLGDLYAGDLYKWADWGYPIFPWEWYQ